MAYTPSELQNILNLVYSSEINSQTKDVLKQILISLKDEINEAEIPSVSTYADLPPASLNAGTIYIVNESTGVIFVNRQKRGLYISDGATWEYLTSFTASQIPFDSSTTNLTATNVQASIEEIMAEQWETTKVVKSASDLASIDSSVCYIIDGMVDMGTQTINVPSGGLFIRGCDYNSSALFSSANNHTLFTGSGSIRATECSLYTTGTNSQIFDMDNEGASGFIELNSCNLGSFSNGNTSLGELVNYRQFALTNVAVININDGLSFSGDWSGGFLIVDTILLNIPANVTVFKEGTALDFQGSSRSNINALSVDDTVTIFDFQDSNFSLDYGFALTGARFNLNSNPIPNFSLNSTKRYFKACRGVTNTFPGGRVTWNSNTTTALDVGVASKAAGTTLYDNLVHYSGPGNNNITYDSNVSISTKVSGEIVLDGGANDQLDVIIRKWDDSASSYVDLDTFSRQITNVLGPLDIAYCNVNTFAELDINDRVEVWIRNNSDGTDVIVRSGSYIVLEERN